MWFVACVPRCREEGVERTPWVLCAEQDRERAGTSCLFSARLLSLLIIAAFSAFPYNLIACSMRMICLLPTGQNSAAQEGRKKAEQMCGGKMLRALYCSLHWLSCPTAPPCLVVLFAPDQPLARKRRFVPQLRSGGTLMLSRSGKAARSRCSL